MAESVLGYWVELSFKFPKNFDRIYSWSHILFNLIRNTWLPISERAREYRIVQEARHRFTIQLVLREEYSDDVSHQLRDRFTKELEEEVTINIQVIDVIPRKGKLWRVISKCLPREQFLSS